MNCSREITKEVWEGGEICGGGVYTSYMGWADSETQQDIPIERQVVYNDKIKWKTL